VRKSEWIRYAHAHDTEKPIFFQAVGRGRKDALDQLEKALGDLGLFPDARARVTKKMRDAMRRIDWSDLQGEHRHKLRKRGEGRRLSEKATYHERLAALADRLDISTSECGDLQDGKFLNDDDAAVVTLIESIGTALVFMQPEFWTQYSTYGAGRPPGAGNEQLNPRPEPGALRQRRRRQRKRDKYSS
jgi:hypothetical protein